MGLTSSSVPVELQQELPAVTEIEIIPEKAEDSSKAEKTVSGGAIFSFLGPKQQLAQWKKAQDDIEEVHVEVDTIGLSTFQFDYETKVSYITLVTTLKPTVLTWLEKMCSGENMISVEQFWKRFFYCLQQRLDSYTYVINQYQTSNPVQQPNVTPEPMHASICSTLQSNQKKMLQITCTVCNVNFDLNNEIIEQLPEGNSQRVVWNTLTAQGSVLTDATLTEYNNIVNALYPDSPSISSKDHVCHHHTGTWVQTSNSTEFATFPPDLQENLRQGKQKRMNDIMKELQWIPDSDHIKDTIGRWSCCELTQYLSEGCERTHKEHQLLVTKK